MTDADAREGLDSEASTPTSNAGDPTAAAHSSSGGPKAPKDRSCPFCNQAFTSSSLGRHLDLYIRPKNPKPPDGVHDVGEIRKLRGGITRRQPRTGTRREAAVGRDGAGWSATAAGSGGGNGRVGMDEEKGEEQEEEESPEGSSPEKRVTADKVVEDAATRWNFNTANWQATGVINNLPARPDSRGQIAAEIPATANGQTQRVREIRGNGAGSRMQRPEYEEESMWKLQEDAEVGRAAELALRELLGSLEAARKKAETRRIFEDIEFCALSFPGLCLALLPPPPALFSTAPFASAHTWPLTPPGDKQFEAMNRVISERVRALRSSNQELDDADVFKHHVHMQGAKEHWGTLSESEKVSAWNLEMQRAFVRERDKKVQFQAELEAAQQRVRHLEAEYDRLSRCQLPREYLLHPPKTTTVSPATMREMRSSDHTPAAEAQYDADALISKWKHTIKATTRSSKTPTASSSSSAAVHYPVTVTPSTSYSEPRRRTLREDMFMSGAVFGVNGAYSRDLDAMGQHKDQSASQVQPAVSYETPQNPGTVISADDDGTTIDADADGEAEEEASRYAGNDGALTTFSRNFQGHSALVNGNGKRPLGHAQDKGGTKVYKMEARRV